MLERAWAFLKAAPLVLLALGAILLALQAGRRARSKAQQEVRLRDSLGPIRPTAIERAQQRARQVESMHRLRSHTQAAQQARQDADAAIERVESAGARSAAELLRNWNRE